MRVTRGPCGGPGAADASPARSVPAAIAASVRPSANPSVAVSPRRPATRVAFAPDGRAYAVG